ncbi:MAG: PqiC family protein [Candidatus Binataceae bacterium]
MTARRAKLIFIAAALAILAGCGSAILAPRPNFERYYVLTPVHGPAAASAAPTVPNPLTIGLGPLRLPAYLEHRSIVTRQAANQIVLSSEDRWAEPLSVNFADVLGEDLSAALENAHIVHYPWYSTVHVDYQVVVHVTRFERTNGADTRLLAEWTIRAGASQRPLLSGDCAADENAQPNTIAGSVAALSADVHQLSNQIAAAIRQLQSEKPDHRGAG